MDDRNPWINWLLAADAYELVKLLRYTRLTTHPLIVNYDKEDQPDYYNKYNDVRKLAVSEARRDPDLQREIDLIRSRRA